MSNQKIAFITGGNRGIGLQTALDLGKQGYAVVIGVRDVKKADGALKELKAAGISADAITWDAARPETDDEVARYFEQKWGRLDVLVNNAGAKHEELFGNSALTLTQQQLKDTFETNVFAVVRLTQKLVPLVRKSSAGRIVNVSSILGSLGTHQAENSPIGGAKAFAYNASKVALNAFTVHLADALKDTNVKVNSAHPGWVKTELGGPHAPMEIGDSSKTSVFLATLGNEGPSGKFFFEQNPLPW